MNLNRNKNNSFVSEDQLFPPSHQSELKNAGKNDQTLQGCGRVRRVIMKLSTRVAVARRLRPWIVKYHGRASFQTTDHTYAVSNSWFALSVRLDSPWVSALSVRLEYPPWFALSIRLDSPWVSALIRREYPPWFALSAMQTIPGRRRDAC